jgi:hypothetical protein
LFQEKYSLLGVPKKAWPGKARLQTNYKFSCYFNINYTIILIVVTTDGNMFQEKSSLKGVLVKNGCEGQV